ncbi:TetR/AcrR family transcriptional regulator [Capillimicrobium parvum]|uniref:HTH-type transcriptional regulator EthR n=1 Tax=Capillimicrobium parvum TaxID=2884022 RepID=A0A9E6Y0W8_9ACTN|nr:TetR/AcrR family transcriptional regulator [Capillimicrobium parvum]UGS38147.1 HTH-type transcriptional regulator EthR [Capillimicrobium parvum]
MASPVRSRRRQQPDETRSLILDTAERLLRERPFRELSVDEVMRPTGYRRTVFYRHFTGMPDLVLAVLARVLPAFAEANQAFLEAAGEEITPERARTLLAPVVEHWQRHGALMRAMRDAAVYDGEIHELVMAAQYRFRATTVAALERRRAAGVLQDADLEQIAELLSAMNQRYLMAAFGGDRPAEQPPVSVETATATLALAWVAVLRAP